MAAPAVPTGSSETAGVSPSTDTGLAKGCPCPGPIGESVLLERVPEVLNLLLQPTRTLVGCRRRFRTSGTRSSRTLSPIGPGQGQPLANPVSVDGLTPAVSDEPVGTAGAAISQARRGRHSLRSE